MFIPYGCQEIDEEDIHAVVTVMRSKYLTQGPVVEQFEHDLSQYCKADYAVAVNSGTAALHIACLSLGVGVGDYLWTSPVSFVASATCGIYCGANVDFIDIDPQTYNISIESFEKKLQAAEKADRLPKVVIAVHLAGQSCEMKRIAALADCYGFRVIEDACHALGGKYLGEPIGSCCYSDITVFSFHPVKSITTGEGGMALTNDGFLAHRLTRLRSHGITKEPAEMTCTSHGPWYYQQLEIGYNYRMNDMEAALGRSQLKRLDNFIAKRHRVAETYNKLLDGLPVYLPTQHPDCFSGMHLYIIRLKDVIEKDRRQIFEELKHRGIGVNLHYIPIHLQPYFQKAGFQEGDFPEAEKYYNEAITLPIFPRLTETQQQYIVSTLREILCWSV